MKKTAIAVALSALALTACQKESMEDLCVKAVKKNLEPTATISAVLAFPTVETPLVQVKFDVPDGTGTLKKGEAQCAFNRPMDEKETPQLVGFLMNKKKFKKGEVHELNLFLQQ